jgi:hypothetical protein
MYRDNERDKRQTPCWVTRRQYRQERTKDEFLRDIVSSTKARGSKLGSQEQKVRRMKGLRM